MRCAEQALQHAPRDPDALYLAGLAQYRGGDLAAAETRLRQAIQADARTPAFHSALGNVLQDRGALGEAISAYQRAVRLKPDFAEAHNDLGTAYFAQGNAARAIQSYLRAAALRPGHAVAHANLGSAYRKLGLPRDARRAMQRELLLRFKSIFRRTSKGPLGLAREELEQGNSRLAMHLARGALASRPGNRAALEVLALAQEAQGLRDEALATFGRAHALEPSDAGVREEIARLLAQAGRKQEAVGHLEEALRLRPRSWRAMAALTELYLALGDAQRSEQLARRALGLWPRDAALHFRLGEALFRQHRVPEAEHALREAIAFDPRSVPARVRLGDLLRLGGRLEEAEACLKEAAALDDASPAVLFALGMVLKERGHSAAAIRRFEEALRIEPGRAQALQQIGEILRYDNQLEQAERRFREGLQERPDRVALLVDLAMVLGDQMRYAEAFAAIDQALAREPGSALALASRGVMLDVTGSEAEAMRTFREALARAPGDVDIGYNLAICRLRHADFAEGWNGFELRRRKDSFIGKYRSFPFPEWAGEPLAGKTILVYPEQGLGDEIMYGSCIRDLAATAHHVAIECDKKLGAIFTRSFPGCTVSARARTMANDWVRHLDPQPDYQVPIGSLPSRFRNHVQAFPAHAGYLRADAAKVAAWRERLATLGPGLKIGLSWQGGVGHTGRLRRSLTLEQLLPLLRLPGMHFVSLQYTDVAAEIAGLAKRHGIQVHHWPEAIDDYDETAALVCALDQVLTVCTAIVHLTGALGRPATVMVPFGSDWRYGASGARMPWYPSVRLIRQRAIGDWANVLEAVMQRLRQSAVG